MKRQLYKVTSEFTVLFFDICRQEREELAISEAKHHRDLNTLPFWCTRAMEQNTHTSVKFKGRMTKNKLILDSIFPPTEQQQYVPERVYLWEVSIAELHSLRQILIYIKH